MTEAFATDLTSVIIVAGVYLLAGFLLFRI